MKTGKWVIVRVAALPLVMLGCVSCTCVDNTWEEYSVTHKLWDNFDPKEKVWIPADKITEAELQKRGVKYEKFTDTTPTGYLIAKSSLAKFSDYSVLVFATPVTVAVDATGVGIVVGAVVGAAVVIGLGAGGGCQFGGHGK
jgi:hypothetical protein